MSSVWLSVSFVGSPLFPLVYMALRYSLDWKRSYISDSYIKYDLLFNSYLRNSSTKCEFLAGKNSGIETRMLKHEHQNMNNDIEPVAGERELF